MADLKNKERCPVCGMDVRTDTIKSEYKGNAYYFCDENDKKQFMGNPGKYIGKAKAA